MRFHLITKKVLLLSFLTGLMTFATSSCQSSSKNNDPRYSDAKIAYPFVGPGHGLGRNGKKEKFVIRSAVGQSEYSVEIPDAGNGYNIEIPLAALAPPSTQEAMAVGAKGYKPPNPVSTDKELVNALPSIEKASPGDVALLDAALGVGSKDGPIQSPSYSMGIAKVNQYFRDKNFDLALMEVNNLLTFYPNSPKLLKMKGTLLLKTGNQELALKSWQRALALSPGDSSLERGTKRLQERLLATERVKSSQKTNQPLDLPSPLPQGVDPDLERLAH